MRTRLAGLLALVAVLGALSGCAGGSAGSSEEKDAAGQTSEASSVPDEWAGSGSGGPPGPSVTAAEERIPEAERARILVAARRVDEALERWDAQVAACAVDAWTACLAPARTRLLGALFGVEGLLWRDRGPREGPCRSGVRSAYEAVYGFRLSQARADYSDPAPGTAPAGDPDLAILQQVVNHLRPVPAALETLAATVCVE